MAKVFTPGGLKATKSRIAEMEKLNGEPASFFDRFKKVIVMFSKSSKIPKQGSESMEPQSTDKEDIRKKALELLQTGDPLEERSGMFSDTIKEIHNK